MVPYRFGATGLEFCLITTRRSQRWTFPKGWAGTDETVRDAALREAWEEAGVTGRIVGDPLGQYRYTKRGRRQSVTVLLMAVENCSDDWVEAGERRRRWASRAKARRLLDRTDLIQLLQAAVERIKAGPAVPRDDAAKRA